jgi:hypothetical protein
MFIIPASFYISLIITSKYLGHDIFERIIYMIHYQKIDKYKRKYRGNISVGKFQGILPTEIFPRYIPRELPWEKKLKQSKKKMITCHFYQRNYRRNFVGKLWILFTMSITKGITDRIFCRYFPESSRTVHFPISLLIVVLYGQNHRRIEKSSVLFGGFLKKFN